MVRICLAIASGENHGGQSLAHSTTGSSPFSVMAGAGKSLWDVGLSADGNQLAFRDQRNPEALDPNNRGQGPWRVFHLLKRKWTDPGDFTPVRQVRDWKGWSVKPNLSNAYLWYARTPDNVDLPLPLDDQRDGMPRCYTFLPPTDKQPLRLAVGHMWGVSIFELTPTSVESRVRLCIRGHPGRSNSGGGDRGWFVPRIGVAGPDDFRLEPGEHLARPADRSPPASRSTTTSYTSRKWTSAVRHGRRGWWTATRSRASISTATPIR